jgi:diguanylate cyclase (GGDEF)-like protein
VGPRLTASGWYERGLGLRRPIDTLLRSLLNSRGGGHPMDTVWQTQVEPAASRRVAVSVRATLALAAATAVLALVALRTPVDPAIAIPAGSSSSLALLAGIGFWTLVAMATTTVAVGEQGGMLLTLHLVPLIAAAALGGPFAVVWVGLIGSTELREVKHLPPLAIVTNHVQVTLPILAVTLALEPFRPSILAAHAAPLSLGVSLATGFAFLVGNSALAALYATQFDLGRARRLVERHTAGWIGLAALIPISWLAAEVYVWVGWWSVLVFGGVLAVWKTAARHDALYREANEDRLTGLLNRRGLEAELAKALGGRNGGPLRPAVVYLDLDGFKAVNDRYGHEAGDQLLTTVARRLVSTVRPGDAVSRLGGDEFVVVLQRMTSDAEVAAVVDRLRTAVSAPIDLGGVEVRVGASLGASLAPEDGVADVGALLESADAAMYRNKAAVGRTDAEALVGYRGTRRAC